MKNLTLILFTFLLASCGLQVKKKNVLKIDPAFSQYVQRFESMGNTKIKNLEFSFGETAHLDREGFTVYGYCQKGTVETNKLLVKEVVEIRKIVINPRVWDRLSIKDKEQLAFHELGHCVLERGHKDSFLGNRPISIMHPYHNQVSPVYTNFYGSYMQELFNKQNLLASWAARAYDNLASGVYEEKGSVENTEGFEEVIPHESEMTEDGCVHDLGTVIINEKEE